MLSSQPIKVSQPKLVLGNYPPSPDTVASKSVPGPDMAQEPVSGSWSLVDSFRCCALCSRLPLDWDCTSLPQYEYESLVRDI